MILKGNMERDKVKYTKEDLCTRCGRCCYYMLDGKLKKCKHLVWITENRAHCRIYRKKDRLGTILDTSINGIKVRCNRREDVQLNYTDCPYNRPEWHDFDSIYLG